MERRFNHSSDLKEIIESYGWTLYLTSKVQKRKAYTFEEMENMGPASDYEIGRNYLFVPIPRDGQTLREAYSITKGFGPSLEIVNLDDDRWLSLEVHRKDYLQNPNVAFFSRLFMEEEYAVASSPRTVFCEEPDLVAIGYEQLVDTFRDNFRIILPEECGLPSVVPSPVIPELN